MKVEYACDTCLEHLELEVKVEDPLEGLRHSATCSGRIWLVA